MRILLIAPPDINMIRTNVPEFVDEGIGVYPPLGLMYIASSVMCRTDWDVSLLDCKAEGIKHDDLENIIKREDPDVVGIQALTFTLIDVMKVARLVKKVNPAIQLVLGGPHVNLYPAESLAMPFVDFLVLGEGEYVICDLLNALGGKRNLHDIKGLGYKIDGKTFINSARKLIDNLDDVPCPDRSLLKIENYYSVVSEHAPITTMMSSRGCPFKCLYCDRPHLGKRFRYRSARNVVDEMIRCREMGIREIFFYDDTFTINKQRVLDICNLLIERKVGIDWDVRAHVNTVDGSLLSKMAQSGCRRMHFGVESGTSEIQKVLRKNLDLEKVKEVFRQAKSNGIKTLAYFMIGCPSETKEQIDRTTDYMLELKADYVHISIATPFPGTDMYALGFSRGLYKDDYWQRFASDPREDFRPLLWNENLSDEELFEAARKAYKKFYLRPSYIVKDFSRLKSITELRRKAVAGIKILFS